MARVLAGVSALPAIVTVAALVVAAGERAGYTPLSEGPPRNAAEAAAMGKASDVLRYLLLGGSPTEVQTLRPDVISPQIVRATVPEAAIWSRQLGLIKLLDTRGALVGDGTRHRLACVAHDIRLDEVVEYLAPDGLDACAADEGIAAVQARSTEAPSDE